MEKNSYDSLALPSLNIHDAGMIRIEFRLDTVCCPSAAGSLTRSHVHNTVPPFLVVPEGLDTQPTILRINRRKMDWREGRGWGRRKEERILRSEARVEHAVFPL